MRMKKLWFCALVCVIFIFSCCVLTDLNYQQQSFALQTNACYNVLHKLEPANVENEQIILTFKHKNFIYNLAENVKKSDVFSIDNTINRYKRFGTKQQRIDLLKQMLGAGFDVNIALDYLFPNLSNLVERCDKNIMLKAQNANLTINSNSEKVFYITKEKLGLKLDKQKLYNNILSAYLSNQSLQFELPTIVLNPLKFAKDYAKFTNLRGDFSTDISTSSADRKHNIKNALNSLNMCEILPGEVFSFNKTIGRRTEANGYRQAKIIVNNEFVEGIGGGVCQVSSTLYNTALLAGLKIIEANKHSKQVGYVKYGFDAMVNFGSSDLKFENTTSQKITIVTNYSSNKIRIRMFGENLNGTEYKLINEVVSITEPQEEIKQDKTGEFANQVQFEDECFVLKKGVKGMEVKSYRQKFENGELVDCQLLRFDKFKPQNTVIVFGTKKRQQQNEQINLFDLLNKKT